MRRHLTSVGLLLLAPVIPLALPLTSCSDSKSDPNPSLTTLGGASAGGSAGAGVTGGTPGSSGVFGTSGTGFGTSGTGFGTNGGTGGPGGVGGTGGTGTGGTGTSGTATGGTGTAGGPAVGRVYTIQGCAADAAGGAGGASGAGGDSSAGGDGAGGDGSGPAMLGTFASFSVYDFDTDKPVQTCLNKVNPFEITVTGDAPLTVVANIAPGITPGSVIFTYDGVPQASQDIFPYGLGFDTNGDYQEPTPKLGSGKHALTISAYALPGGMGNVVGEASIVLTVVGN